MQAYIRQIFHSRFVRSVVIVATGTAGAQAITMAFTPIITRIYGPEAFGLLGTFMAIVAVVVPLAALAYPNAIVLPRDDRDAIAIARLSVVLSVVIASLTAFMLLISGAWIAEKINAKSLEDYLLLIPFAMLFAAWLEITQQLLIRKKLFSSLARTAVSQSVFINTAKLGFGWLSPTSTVLIVIATLGNALYAAMLSFIVYRSSIDKMAERSVFGSISLKKIAYRHRDFPIYRAPQNFINAISQNFPVLMLATFFGPAAAGFYTLGKMVMSVPSGLVGKAVSDVFYPKITEASHKGENLSPKIIKSTFILFLIGLVPFGSIIIFGKSIFVFIFGENWSEAGVYAQWLAPFFLFNLINKPSVVAVPVLGIQAGLLIYEIFSSLSKIIGLLIGFYWFESDIWAIGLFSIIGIINYVVMIVWIIFVANHEKYNANTS